MIKNIFCGFALMFLALGFFSNTYASEIKIEAKNVEYNLPYPGILPDNQLYSFKIIRDSLMDFFTRDFLKKAELNLLFADKKIAMASELSKKNKWSIAKKTISEAEDHYQKIIDALVESKKQGTSASGDFILKVKLSNEKHRQTIEDLLKEAPSGDTVYFEETLKENKQISQQLTHL
jgi:hypothetical protein